MKQLLQIIALNVFGLNALQIIVSMGSVMMLLQIAVKDISGRQKRWQIRKRNRRMENNMWAIE